MATAVRWGLLSTANINPWLIAPIRASPRGELAAIASRNPDKAQAYATKWDIPNAFGSYQEMLDSGKVDAVYISLPNHLHAEWTIRALQAGVHVLCEKPFAITLDEVDRMIAASRQSGCVLAEAIMYRHHPQTSIVGEWVQSGRLGKINQIWGLFNVRLDARDNVRMVPEYGGGCLWDLGVYPVSFVQYVYGSLLEEVSGMQCPGDTGVDETFAGQMRYSGERLAQIAASFSNPFNDRVEIIGSEGQLSLNRPFTPDDKDSRLLFYPAKGDPEEIPVPEQELYIGEVEDMHAAILDGTPSYVTLEETRNHVRTILALYQSAQTGRPVRL